MNIVTDDDRRHVEYISRAYSRSGLPLDDLRSEGFVGLLNAYRTYDPSKGASFKTFSEYWIRGTILSYIYKETTNLSLQDSKVERFLFYNLHKYKDPNCKLTENGIREMLKDFPGLTKERVIKMDSALTKAYYSDDSLDSLVDNISPEFLAMLHEEIQLLDNSLIKLKERSRIILLERAIHETTLKALSSIFNISIERVRQIEEEARTKVIKDMKNEKSS